MKKDYSTENTIFLYSNLNLALKSTYQMLKFDTESYVDKFCLNDKSIKEYYLNKFDEVQEEILKVKIEDFNTSDIFNLAFKNGSPQIDLKEFFYFSIKFLKIPKDYNIEKKELEQHSEMKKTGFDIEIIFEQHNNVYNRIQIDNAYLNLNLSIKLFYFKHLLNEHKEVETNPIKVKNLPTFEVYQRYLLLDQILNVDYQITSLQTSKNSINKIMAILLNCSTDTAKDIINGAYSDRVKNIEDKKDEVSNFIERLKIKNKKEV